MRLANAARPADLCATRRAQPDLPRRRRRSRAARSGAHGRARYGWAGPTGTVVLRRGRRRAVRSRRVQHHEPHGLLGPGPSGHRDDRRRQPGARRRRTRDPVEAEDNAQVLLDFGDAASAWSPPGSRCSSIARRLSRSMAARERSRCSATIGPPRVMSCGGAMSARGVRSRTRPGLAWTDGLRHLVECIQSRTPDDLRPEHAYHALEIMLAAQAAGRDGTARTIESDFPDPGVTTRCGSGTKPSATPTTAGATMGYKPSPRPSFDRESSRPTVAWPPSIRLPLVRR